MTNSEGALADTLDMTTTAEPPVKPLTLADRCDRCGAEAFVRATKENTLLFCGHHGVEFREALSLQGFLVEDFRTLINVKPSQSSA